MVELHYFQACEDQIDSGRTPVFRKNDRVVDLRYLLLVVLQND